MNIISITFLKDCFLLEHNALQVTSAQRYVTRPFEFPRLIFQRDAEIKAQHQVSKLFLLNTAVVL